jgi:hypothetical protein
MRKSLLNVAIASAFAAFSFASYAQTAGQAAEKDSYGNESAAPSPAAPAGSMESRYGRSPACDSKSGAEKEQCLRDEAAKTQGSASDDKAGSGSASSGSGLPSAPAADSAAPTPAPSTSEAPAAEKP